MNRMHRFGVLAGAIAAATAVYACSGDDTDIPVPPPLNDAGTDGSASHPGSEAGTPPADGGGDSGDAGVPGDGSTTTNPDASSDGGPSVACSSLPGSIVYIESGDTQEALLKHLGRQLRDTFNVTIVFELTGSCALTPALFDGTPLAAGQSMLYIPSTAENPTWNPATSTESTCSITAPTPPDLGISALYTGSCGLGGPDAGTSIGLIQGPIQAYTFIVPPTNFSAVGQAIYAEEAHTAFGNHKGAGLVTFNSTVEWNVPAQMFFRPVTKSTLVSTAFNIQLTAAVMGGGGAVQEAASSQVLSAVAAATDPNAIGILGDEVYDTQGRGKVNVLAFKAFGQNAAYYPDSTITAYDKQNIRDGHYTLWSPTVYITKVDGTNTPTNPSVKTITDQVLGNPDSAADAGAADAGIDYPGLDDVIGVGLTPGCAMQITRDTLTDGTPLSLAAAAPSCTCYFLSKIPGATGTPANCSTCTDSSTCGTGLTCQRGFCEGAGAGAPPAVTDGGAGCVTNPTASADIPNGCTGATAVTKAGIVLGDAGP